MKFNEKDWKECLDSLGFTEQKNKFGAMVVYNDKDLPLWIYQTEEEQKELFIFFNGAVYWKIHTMFN